MKVTSIRKQIHQLNLALFSLLKNCDITIYFTIKRRIKINLFLDKLNNIVIQNFG